MKFVRFRSEPNQEVRLGLLLDRQIFDLEERAPRVLHRGDMKALLSLPRRALDELVEAALDTLPVLADDERLLAPIQNPGKILALAANYTHDGADPIPDIATPWIFCKMTDEISGPASPIVLWPFSPEVVEEIEVAIVIGKPGRDIPVERALEHVAGYTILNDVSGRSLNLLPVRRREASDGFFDWLNGKWLDGFTILGPAIVTPDEMPDLGDLKIASRVNGELRVEGSTRHIIHGFADVIAHASRLVTLRTGDIIGTGMPHGADDHEVYLKAGDVVEGEIAGLGILRNPVVSVGR